MINITLTQLEYVVAVDNYRHFARAAEKCFVTQPTLSMQIMKLEEHLGIKLFDRSRQPVVPTEIGKKVIEQARDALKAASRIDDLVKQHTAEISGELRLGIIPTLGPFLLPLFAGNFMRKYPGVALTVEELVTDSIIRRLKNETLDAGLFVTPAHESSIIEEPLFYEEMLLYAHPSHSLLSKPVVEIKDMNSPELWLLNDGHCFRHQVVNLCGAGSHAGEGLPFHLEGGSLETLVRLIDREGGFTLLPELATLLLPPEKQDSLIRFSDVTPLREVSLVRSRYYAKQNLLEALRTQIMTDIPQYMKDPGRGQVVEWKEPK